MLQIAESSTSQVEVLEGQEWRGVEGYHVDPHDAQARATNLILSGACDRARVTPVKPAIFAATYEPVADGEVHCPAEGAVHKVREAIEALEEIRHEMSQRVAQGEVSLDGALAEAETALRSLTGRGAVNQSSDGPHIEATVVLEVTSDRHVRVHDVKVKGAEDVARDLRLWLQAVLTAASGGAQQG